MAATRVCPIDPDQPDPSLIAEAAAILRSGGLVAFATETVYGLGAVATDPAAVARIFAAKGRPATNPLIVHVADVADARACVAAWPDSAAALAGRCWPGPLTLVLPRSSLIPDIVTAGQATVGVRVPQPAVARALIRATGHPIAAPSANRSTGISPTSADAVLADLDGRVDLVLDSGRTTIGLESTVLDLDADPPRLLRPGAITPEAIGGWLGVAVRLPDRAGLDPDSVARSPGQMAIHYAPRTAAYRVERDRLPVGLAIGSRFAALVLGEPVAADLGPDCERLAHLADPVTAARDLYAALRAADALGGDFILIVAPPDRPEWRAIRDRIGRAAQPWPG